MYYIQSTPTENGNYGNPYNAPFEGAFLLPDNLLQDYLGTMGFAILTVENGEITEIERNTEAYNAYKAAHPDETEPELSDIELLLELAADHEERLCLIELGVTL